MSKVIPFPVRFRLSPQGEHAVPAKVIRFKPRDAESRAYALYSEASRIDEVPARYQDALSLYRLAIDLDPSLAIVYTNMGNVYHNLGDTALARHYYNEALALDPFQPEAIYNVGYLHMCEGNLEDAAKWLEQAIVARPKFEDAHFNLAMVYQQQGDKRARDQWSRYLGLDPRGEWADVARAQLAKLTKPKRTRRSRKA
jgi:tetratricopeptide (TPR) repeat protein